MLKAVSRLVLCTISYCRHHLGPLCYQSVAAQETRCGFYQTKIIGICYLSSRCNRPREAMHSSSKQSLYARSSKYDRYYPTRLINAARDCRLRTKMTLNADAWLRIKHPRQDGQKFLVTVLRWTTENATVRQPTEESLMISSLPTMTDIVVNILNSVLVALRRPLFI